MRITVEDAEEVVRAHRSSGQRIAIVLDDAAPGRRPGAPSPYHLRPDGEHPDGGARVLQAAGWRVMRVPAGTALSEVWNVIEPLLRDPGGQPAMNPRTQLAVAATGVTLLSTTSLHAVFVDTGLGRARSSGVVLAVLAGAEIGSRLGQHLVARPVWRFVGSALAAIFFITAVYAHEGAIFGFIPRGHTWHLLNAMRHKAFTEIHNLPTPAPTYRAIMMVTAFGVARSGDRGRPAERPRAADRAARCWRSTRSPSGCPTTAQAGSRWRSAVPATSGC